jgi:hypothetical protein
MMPATRLLCNASPAGDQKGTAMEVTAGAKVQGRIGKVSAGIARCKARLMDGLVALKDGKMISLRVPYPLGFYANGLGWVHLRFCSSYCETLHDLLRRDQNARSHWHKFLTDGSP